MDFNKLLQLKADSPQNVLKKLYEHSKNEEDKEKPILPQLTLMLSGGVLISGFLLDYNISNGEILLGQLHEGMPDLKYCNSASVMSLELHNTTPFMYLLSNGKIAFQPADSEVPSKLELKRLISDMRMKLSEKLDKEIALLFDVNNIGSPMELYTCKLLIQTMINVLFTISENDLGKEALKEKVGTVELQIGEANSIGLHEGTLKITCKVENSPALGWDFADLRDKIEEKL